MFSGYNTVESADDLEALRGALGVEKISLWGISYGTHLALATIRRHGERINRAIMAGVEGPDHTMKLPSNYQKHLENISRLVRNDSRIGTQVPDLMSLLKSVLARLEQPILLRIVEPQTKEYVNVAVCKFDLQLMLASELGSSRFVKALPSMLYTMSQGDFSPLAKWVLGFKRMNWKAYAMPSMMDCASGASEARLKQIVSETESSLLGEAVNFPFPSICEALGHPDLGSDFRAPVRSSVPALLISGTLDGNTPISNAEEVQAGFPRSEHLVIDGAGHSDDLFLSSPRILEVILEFMRGQPLSTKHISLPPLAFDEVSRT